MANSTVSLTFEINEKGSLVKIEQNVNKASRAVKDLNAAQDAGTKSTKKHNDVMNGGVASANNSARGMSKLLETVGGNNSGLVAAYATLATNAFAVSAAFTQLRGAAQAEQVLKGIEAQGARTGITLTRTAKAVQEISGYTLSANEAMQTTAQAAAAGIKGDMLSKLTQGAADASFALGRNMSDSIDRVIKGVTKLEPELLDELGVMTKLTEASEIYALANGKTASSLSGVEKRMAFTNAVSAELQAKFGGLSEEAGDTRNYDKLSATFQNLIKDTFSVVNTLLGPLIRLLSSSPTALLGSLVLFGSTISGPLIKSMNDLHERLDAQSKKLKETAAAQRLVTEATLADAKANAMAARASFVDKPTGRAPQAYKKGFDQFKAGTASVEQYDAAIKGLTTSSKRYSLELEKLEAVEKVKTAGDLQRISTLETRILLREEEIDQLRRAKIAEMELATQSKAVQADQLSEIVTEAQARKTGAAAGALQHAQNFELISSSKKIGEATREYSNQLKAQSAAAAAGGAVTAGSWKAVTSAWDLAKVAGFGLSLSIKAIGTSILAALPWIGLATVAIGILIDLWNKYGKSDATKKVEEAQAAFNDTLENTNKSIKERQRLEESLATLGTKTQQRLTLEANSITGIVDTYQKLYEAKKAAGEVKGGPAVDKTKGAATLSEVVATQSATGQAMQLSSSLAPLGEKSGEYQASKKAVAELREESQKLNLSYKLNIDKNDEFLISLGKVKDLNPYDDLTLSLVKSLNAIQKLTPSKEFDKIIDQHGGISTVMTDFENGASTLYDFRARAEGVASAVEDIRTGLKQVNDALSKFNTSAIATTPFDEATASLTNLTESLYKMQKTGFSNEEWAGILSGLGPQLEAQLSTDLQLKMSQVRVDDQLLSNIKAKQAANITLSAEEDAQLKSLQKKVIAFAVNTAEIEKQITKRRDEFALQQQITRENQAQIGVIQAILSANSDAYKQGAAGAAARQKREQEIRDLQKQQLQGQINLIKNSIILQQEKLKSLNLSKKENIEEQRKADLIALQGKQEALNAAKKLARKQGISEELLVNPLQGVSAKTFNDLAAGYNKANAVAIRAGEETAAAGQKAYESYMAARQGFKEMTTAQAQLNKSELGLQLTRDIKDESQQINALQKQLNALTQADLTTGQKRAEQLEAQNQLHNEIIDSANKNQKAQQTLINGEQRLTSLLSQQVNLELDRQKILEGTQSTLKDTKDSFEKDIGMLYSSQARMQANINAASAKGNSAELTAYQEGLKVIQGKISARQVEYGLQVQQIGLDAKTQIYESLSVKNRQDSLKVLQDTVSQAQKSLDLAKEELDITNDMAKRKALIRVKLAGGDTIDPRAEAAIDYSAALKVQKLAQEQFNLKIEAIDYEYDLLFLQQKLNVEKYKQDTAYLKALMIAQSGGKGLTAEQSQVITDMTSAIGRMEKYSLEDQRAAAKRIEQGKLDQSNIAVLEARMKMSPIAATGGNAAMAGGAQALEYIRAVTEARKTQGTKEPTKSPEQQVVESNTNLVSAIDELTAAYLKSIGEMEKRSPQDWDKVFGQPIADIIASTKNIMSITEAASYAKTQGGTVSEFKPYGQEVSKVHSGAGHSESRAFDLNLAGGKAESLDPALKSRMDSLAQYYVEQGFTVLWNGYKKVLGQADEAIGKPKNVKTGADWQHTGHMHVETPGDKNQLARVTASALGRETPKDSTQILGEAFTTALKSNNTTLATLTGQATAAALDSTKNPAVPSGTTVTGTAANDNAAPAQAAAAGQTADAASESAKKAKLSFGELATSVEIATGPMLEQMKQISPEGALFGTAMQGLTQLASGIGNFSTNIAQVMADSDKLGLNINKSALKWQAGLQLAAAAIGVVSSVLAQANSLAIANIDKQIAAEQKRDGKSKESVDKLNSLEKKKDDQAKKSFNIQKKLAMASAVISTAAAIAGILAHSLELGPAAIPLAAIIGAMGVAQIALIASTSYQSSYTPSSVTAPSSLSVGKRSDTVDLAKGPNANAGGEVSYLRGSSGTGSNASNYRTVGSAYGGELMRGYGNRGFVVGEKGPEVITPDTPISVTPANDVGQAQSINASFNIQALDSQGVQDILVGQKGNIIKMLRQAANASGKTFMEDVNVNVYTRPSVGKL